MREIKGLREKREESLTLSLKEKGHFFLVKDIYVCLRWYIISKGTKSY